MISTFHTRSKKLWPDLSQTTHLCSTVASPQRMMSNSAQKYSLLLLTASQT